MYCNRFSYSRFFLKTFCWKKTSGSSVWLLLFIDFELVDYITLALLLWRHVGVGHFHEFVEVDCRKESVAFERSRDLGQVDSVKQLGSEGRGVDLRSADHPDSLTYVWTLFQRFYGILQNVRMTKNSETVWNTKWLNWPSNQSVQTAQRSYQLSMGKLSQIVCVCARVCACVRVWIISRSLQFFKGLSSNYAHSTKEDPQYFDSYVEFYSKTKQ